MAKLVVGHIKTRQLQLLAQLRQTGSVLQAAATLGMSQSAASRLLGNLESEIGAPLFERHARGVTPTVYGEAVTRRAMSALAEIARAAVEVDELARGNRTPLSIGCLISQSATYLPAVLVALAQRAPEIMVEAHSDRSATLIAGLMEARFDLVIARVRDASLEPDLMFEPLVDEPIGVFARPGHPLARRKKLTLQDVAAYPWIMPPRETDLRVRLDALCAQNGLPRFDGMLQTMSIPVILSMLPQSDALVALPDDFARPFCEMRSMTALNIELGVRTENVGIITRRHHEMSPQLRTGLQVFREVAATMYGEESSARQRKARRTDRP